MKLFLCFLLILLSKSKDVSSQSLSDDEYEKVEKAVTDYTGLFELLSKCKGNNAVNLVPELLKQNDGRNLKNSIYNDLFADESDEGYRENIEIGEYLTNLETRFQFNIDVVFSNMSVINCKTVNDNRFFALMTVDKELVFQGKTKKCSLLFFVNLKDYTITQITSPYLLIKEKKKCWEQVPEINITDEIRRLRTEADKYFGQKDYLRAQNLYQVIINKVPEDLTVLKRADECTKLITLQNLLTEASEFYNEGKYESSLRIYTRVLNTQSNADKADIEFRIRLCKDKFNDQQYGYYIGKGDAYLRVTNFEEARKSYIKALEYRSNDNYALKKIEESKLNDKRFARNEISRAIKLAEASKKNFGEAFKIMCEFEGSGLLTTQNYYFLTLLMSNRNENVKNYMNLNNKDCGYYLKNFSISLRVWADSEPNTEIREKALQLLDEVVNKRNQLPNKRNQKKPL